MKVAITGSTGLAGNTKVIEATPYCGESFIQYIVSPIHIDFKQ